MKKLIFLITALLFFTVGIQAQSGTTVLFGVNSTEAHYTPVAADTLNTTSAPTKYWQFLVNKNQLYYYVVTARIDQVTTVSRSAGAHCILTMYGSVDGTNWVSVDTTLFHPTTGNFSEGAIHVTASDVSTGVLWKYLKFSATATDANKAVKLYSLAVKIGLRY